MKRQMVRLRRARTTAWGSGVPVGMSPRLTGRSSRDYLSVRPIHPFPPPRPPMSYLKAELAELMELARTRYSLEETYRSLALHELLAAPGIEWDAATLAACEAAYERFVAPGGAGPVPREEIGVAPWVFLEYLSRHRGLLLHGSPRADLGVIEPRTASDNIEDGDTSKVHAASGALLPLFFAILDRRRMLEVPCVPAFNALQVERDGMPDGYWFVLDHRAIPFRPWRGGAVYVLPREPFRDEHRGMQWSTTGPVVPLARIAVTPEDFPMSDHVYGMDFAEEHRRTNAGIPGFPWRGDPALYPDERYRPEP